MAAMTARFMEAPVPLGEYVPTADPRILMYGMTWASFEALLAARGERRRPLMAYLDGVVELMGASRDHEQIKSSIHNLVAAYCLDRAIPFMGYGNFLIKDESVEAGAEPDDCFVFGNDLKQRQRPDLVIEVIWTSGGLDKLKLYRRLGVDEVWFWKQDRLSIHALGPDGYEQREVSRWVPELPPRLICELLAFDTVNEMVARMRAALAT